MPWHQSLSNPRKVYNERHEQVCICETPEQAALIVEAVRAFVPPVPRENSSLITPPSTLRIPMPPGARKPKKPEPEDDDGSFAII